MICRKRPRATGWPRTNYLALRGRRFGRLTVVRDTGRRTTWETVVMFGACDGVTRDLVEG